MTEFKTSANINLAIDFMDSFLDQNLTKKIMSAPLTIVKKNFSQEGMELNESLFAEVKTGIGNYFHDFEASDSPQIIFSDDHQVYSHENEFYASNDYPACQEVNLNDEKQFEVVSKQQTGDENHSEQELEVICDLWGSSNLEDQRYYISHTEQLEDQQVEYLEEASSQLSDENSSSEEGSQDDSSENTDSEEDEGSLQGSEQESVSYSSDSESEMGQEKEEILPQIQEESEESDCQVQENRLIVLLATENLIKL